MHDNDYDYDDCGETNLNTNFMFMLDVMRENKEFGKYNEIYLYKMNLYLAAFIHLSNALMEHCPTNTWPMASEMGDEDLGQEIANEFVAEFISSLKAKPSKKKK